MSSRLFRAGLLALSISAILLSCSTPGFFKLSRTNFGLIVDPFQNLEFEFSAALAPDSLIDKVDTTAYITFEPALKGVYKWASPEKLVFMPSAPFAPNTDYKAVVTKQVGRFSDLKPDESIKPIEFHTPYLTLERSNAYWGINEADKNQIQLKVSMQFNYAVNIDEIRQKLAVALKEQPKTFDISEVTEANQITIAIPASVNEKLDGNINLTLKKGFRCIGSEREIPSDEVYSTPVPPRDALNISDVSADFVDAEGVITFYTTQPVVEKGLKGLIKVNPHVDFQASTAGNGFNITGAFADGQSYEVWVSGKLKGVFGPALEVDFQQAVTFGSLKPYIAFSDQNSLYLTPKGAGNLGLSIINIPKVKITVFKVFENNIQHYLRNGKEWDWYYDEDEYYDSYNYRIDENFGQKISSREIDTRTLPRQGNLKLLNLNPADLQLTSELKGIYLIRAESTEKTWLSDVQLVAVSDIGLIVKEGNDEVFVAARSISTAQPMEGVSIRFFSSNNQLMHQAVTGSDGTLVFKDISKIAPGFKIAMLSARKGDDFNVLLYDRSYVETSRFDIGGKRTAGMISDVFVYGDRNLYRPGDSVFSNIIVRSFAWDVIKDIPVKFRVITPDGKDLLVRRSQLGREGSAQIAFHLPEASLTGSYTLEVLSGNDVMMGSRRFSVEDFMPDRIKVNVKPNKNSFKPGEVIALAIKADNLFGTPAANRKVENELRISRKSFYPSQYRNFNFDIKTSADVYFENQLSEGSTDANGMFAQEFVLPDFMNIGILEAKTFTTVFDENGRPVNRLTKAEILTQEAMLGIQRTPGWVSTKRPQKISLIALSPQEKPVNAKARIEVVQIRWENVLERNYGQTRYRSQKKEVAVYSREASIPASGYNFQYTPPVSGEYEIRVSLPGSSNYVASWFYAYGSSDFSTSSFYVNREGEVGIEADKETYKPGETAGILFKTPFEGELLVTIEQDKILEHYTLKADASGATLKLKITESHLPNIYVSATLIRKADGSGLPLTVGHGVASITVEKPDNKLNVNIENPERIRSKTTQKIKVKTSPGAEVTLAVVDEGILQITSYTSPDPYAWFYGKRALEVKSYDIFDELFPELSIKRSSSGGDMGFDMGSRLNPLTTKRVKLLSLWSGIKKANSSGEVVFDANIPAFSGAVRIMAVAYKGSLFGSSEKEMKVADPLIISSSLPRFLSPGDKAEVIITLTNTTSKAVTTTLKATTKGPVKASGVSGTKVNIPANSEIQTSFDLEALQPGKAEINLMAAQGGETFSEETNISVRPAAALEKTSISGVLNAGAKTSLTNSNDYLEGTKKSRILITRSPAAKFAGELSELVNYPHGCMEQTISAAFPQIYFADLAKMLKQDSKAAQSNTTENVNAAIMKISAYQQYNGGLVTWPSGGEVHWWNTAYAANFLYEANQAGFAVNQNVIDNLIRFLTEKVKQKETTEYFYMSDGGNSWKRVNQPYRETFYSLYVLALYGKQHMPTMNYYKARANELSLDSRYLLACTYALTGDKKSFTALLPANWDKSHEPMRMTGGSFSSPVRDKAIALYTLLNADPDNKQIAMLSRQLGEMLNKRNYLSTQERAFALLALGKLAGKATEGKITAEIEVNGKKIGTFSDKDFIADINGDKVTIKTSGTGNLYYYLETEGVPENNSSRNEDQVLMVRRKFFDRNGKTVNVAELNRNDLVVVEVSLSTTDNSFVENVVITDILPACFETENTRLTVNRDLPWAIEKAVPEHTDYRDDRVNIFTSANGQIKKFYYMVRVTGKGTYLQGPVSAEAMYNGMYYSYSGSNKILVR